MKNNKRNFSTNQKGLVGPLIFLIIGGTIIGVLFIIFSFFVLNKDSTSLDKNTSQDSSSTTKPTNNSTVEANPSVKPCLDFDNTGCDEDPEDLAPE